MDLPEPLGPKIAHVSPVRIVSETGPKIGFAALSRIVMSSHPDDIQRAIRSMSSPQHAGAGADRLRVGELRAWIS